MTPLSIVRQATQVARARVVGGSLPRRDVHLTRPHPESAAAATRVPEGVGVVTYLIRAAERELFKSCLRSRLLPWATAANLFGAS